MTIHANTEGCQHQRFFPMLTPKMVTMSTLKITLLSKIVVSMLIRYGRHVNILDYYPKDYRYINTHRVYMVTLLTPKMIAMLTTKYCNTAITPDNHLISIKYDDCDHPGILLLYTLNSSIILTKRNR